MSELETLKKLVTVLRNQRTFAFDKLAEMEVTLIMERETAAEKFKLADAIHATSDRIPTKDVGSLPRRGRGAKSVQEASQKNKPDA
jgi:hypothetical protein